jgi:hypothetical protein
LVSEQALGKTGQGPIFPLNFKVACQAKLGLPKTEVLEQPQFLAKFPMIFKAQNFQKNMPSKKC